MTKGAPTSGALYRKEYAEAAEKNLTPVMSFFNRYGYQMGMGALFVSMGCMVVTAAAPAGFASIGSMMIGISAVGKIYKTATVALSRDIDNGTLVARWRAALEKKQEAERDAVSALLARTAANGFNGASAANATLRSSPRR